MLDKNGCLVLYLFNWCKCWEGTEFLGTKPIRLILTFDGEYIFRKLDSGEKKLWPLLNTLNGPLWSAVTPVPETDTPLLQVSLVIRRSLPVVVMSKMCVASWSRWFQTAMFRALRLSLKLTFCGKRFATPQTLIFFFFFTVIIPRISLYGVSRCLIVGSEHIARLNATSSHKTLTSL